MPITNPSPTRVRVLFDEPITPGAVSPSFYAVRSLDALGSNPTVSYVFVVDGSPNGVEIVLSDALADGGLYEVAWTQAPLESGPVDGAETWRVGQRTDRRENAPQIEPIEPLLYGVDLAWVRDFQIAADGDLAGVTGAGLVLEAAERRQTSDGLIWDPSYSPRLREFVDAPEGAAPSVRTAVLADLLRDDRVARATVDLPTIEDDAAVFPCTIWPRANPEAPQRFSLRIPIS